VATTLYLTNTASDLDLGVETEYKFSLTRGDAAVSETAPGGAISNVDDANGIIYWYSPPLNAVTISGPITVNLRMAEEFATTNLGAYIQVYRTDNAGVAIEVILDGARGVEMGTSEADQNWAPTVTPSTLVAGDRLLVLVIASEVGTAGAGVATLWFDGPTGGASGDSFITFTETITEQAGGAAYAWPRLTIRKNRRILL